MKKEDLCMLLIVVALVLIISRNTKIFEGFSINDLPATMTESDKKTIMDMVASGKISEEQLEQQFGSNPESAMPPAKPPTPPKPAMPPAKPPTPPKPAMPPAKPPTPPKPAMPPAKPPTPPKPAMPPAKPPTPPTPAMPPAQRPTPPKPAMPPAKAAGNSGAAPGFPTPMETMDGPTPFGSPFSDNKPSAFGQDFVSAFDRSVDLFAGPDQDMNVIIPSSTAEESLTKKYLGTLQPQIMQNLDEVRTHGSVAGAEFQPYDPSSMSGSLLDNQFAGLQVGLQQPSVQPGQQPVMPPTNRGMVQPPSKQMMPPTAPMGPGGEGPGGEGPGGAGGAEVHFVFGEWCGHSRNAKPEFQGLVSRTDVTTSNGIPVKFVMTEDTSPGMEKFKSSVQGFPSYMLVKPDGQMEELMGHNRTADSIVSIVQGKSV